MWAFQTWAAANNVMKIEAIGCLIVFSNHSSPCGVDLTCLEAVVLEHLQETPWHQWAEDISKHKFVWQGSSSADLARLLLPSYLHRDCGCKVFWRPTGQAVSEHLVLLRRIYAWQLLHCSTVELLASETASLKAGSSKWLFSTASSWSRGFLREQF